MKHKSRHQYLITISPAVDKFVLDSAKEQGVNTEEYNLPSTLKEFTKLSKSVISNTDERNTEEIKDQILGLLDELHNPNLTITRIYEKWQNVFADFSYDTIKNQYLMSPYAGLRIEGYIETRVSCQNR